MQIEPASSFPDLRLAQITCRQGRSLPRWTASGAIYHVAFHLADSIPQTELAFWRELRSEITLRAKEEDRPLTAEEIDLLRSCYDEKVERYLAAGCGECILKSAGVYEVLEQVILYDNGRDYAIHEYCFMPNHLHVIVGGFPAAEMVAHTIRAWKSVSAHKINKMLSRTGDVWMKDAYTRIIRNEEEYRRQLSYVWMNPESANMTMGFLRNRFVEWM